MTTGIRCVSGDRLSARDVYDIWKIRDAVFSVEQRCDVEDVDGRDLLPGTTHVWLSDDEGPTSYLRVYTADDGEHRIGRVCTRRDRRGRGLSTALMSEVDRLWGDGPLGLNAQAHLERWYEGFGFVRCGDDFMEAGIPHVPMRRLRGDMA